MGLSAKFNIDEKLVDRKARLVLFKTMLGMFNTAKRLAPVDTGRLRNSIRLTPSAIGSDLFILSANVDYAADVEFGTKPHLIKPSSKSVLSFNIKGKRIFAGSVQHPGTRPQPFFRPALFQAKNKNVKKIFKETFKK